MQAQTINKRKQLPPPKKKAQETKGYISNLEALKNKDIIDVGAYIGDSALILLEYTIKRHFKSKFFHLKTKRFDLKCKN